MDGLIPGIRYGKVVNDIDETGADMLAIRLIPDDNDVISNEDLVVNAFPLLPKMFYVKPKVDEGVFVLLTNWNNGDSQRYYIGPVISQGHRMYFDRAHEGGDSYQRSAKKALDVNPEQQNEGMAIGAYPNTSDIAVIGRKNCDIIVKDDDIRIRAGVKLVDEFQPYSVSFNYNNPAFIKLKYHERALDSGDKSTATIVADKIALLSNKSTEVALKPTDTKDLITDKELNEIIEDAYKLPYGEKLVKLLKQMIDIFCNHTHDYVDLPPNQAWVNEIRAAANEPLEQLKLLSDTVRIN